MELERTDISVIAAENTLAAGLPNDRRPDSTPTLGDRLTSTERTAVAAVRVEGEFCRSVAAAYADKGAMAGHLVFASLSSDRGAVRLQPKSLQPVPHGRDAETDFGGDRSVASACFDQLRELGPGYAAPWRVALGMCRRNPMLLKPVRDRAWVYAEPCGNPFQRESAPEQVLQDILVHASIIRRAPDGKANVCSHSVRMDMSGGVITVAACEPD